MYDFKKSETKVDDATVERMVSEGIANPWRHPRTGKMRYYINTEGMEAVIGLSVSYYKSGHCSGCSYIDADGSEVGVAHARGWNERMSDVYIQDGTVYSNWSPYGRNIAELFALKAMAIDKEDAS